VFFQKFFLGAKSLNTFMEKKETDEDVWLVYPWENVGTYG